jgi:hypothetical protein
MITFSEVLQYLKKGKTVELKFHLNFGLFSRHELCLVDGKIEDFSYVDESRSRSKNTRNLSTAKILKKARFNWMRFINGK